MNNTIHSCSYYCHIPACIKAQRDELRDKLYQRTWVGLDLDERAACYEASGGNLSKFAAQIEAKLKEKNT